MQRVQLLLVTLGLVGVGLLLIGLSREQRAPAVLSSSLCTANTSSRMDVWILAGQSNAVGCETVGIHVLMISTSSSRYNFLQNKKPLPEASRPWPGCVMMFRHGRQVVSIFFFSVPHGATTDRMPGGQMRLPTSILVCTILA